MRNRSGLKRSPSDSDPKTPSPKRSSSKTDDVDVSPQSVAAKGADLSDPVVADEEVAKKPSAAHPNGAGDDKISDESVVATVEVEVDCSDDALRSEYMELRDSSPTGAHSLMMVMRHLPTSFNIFHPIRNSITFVVYSTFVFSSPIAMKVLHTAFLWFEHERYNQTNARWPSNEIFLSVADSTDDMMSHEYVANRSVSFLPFCQIQRAILAFPAIAEESVEGSDVVTVPNASIRDVSPSADDGSVASLRASLLTPPSRR